MIFLVGLQSCLKDHEEDIRAEEMELLAHYISKNNITVSPTESGLYYIEHQAGSGLFPQSTDWLEISYTIRLVRTNEVVMTTDSAIAVDNQIYVENAIYGPNRVLMGTISIRGLYEGLSKMKEGGKATLIFPSSLGFGNVPYGAISAYSSLIIDVELHHVISNIKNFERAKMNSYLLDNNIPLGDTTLSGLYYIEIHPGTGDSPKIGNVVEIIYKGSFLDGRVFDELLLDKTYSFYIGYGQVIEGLEEGIKLMKKGGIAKLVIPYYLGYGTDGYVSAYYGTLIWPYTTLVFEVSLLDVK